jgi:CheY-like chemotaxis protein
VTSPAEPPGAGGAPEGLGLASAFAIVRDHDGWLECESAPGRGTTISVYLPAAAPAAEGAAPVTATGPADSPPGGRGERILVIDDEDLVRRVVDLVLGDAGYEVVTAASGAEGIRAVEEAPSGFDLVLLDEAMPGMAGREVACAIRARRPRLKIVLFSGHSPEATPGVAGFIEKPVGERDLLEKLRAFLDAPEGR